MKLSKLLFHSVFTLASFEICHSQTQANACTGVLGPPVAQITFGAGSNPGPQLPPNTTSYTYAPLCAGNAPNSYSIVNSVTNCRNGWLNVPQDHTPNDVNGYMMLVDAHTTPGVIFTRQVSGLQSNFPYEFSVFVGNIYDPNFQGCGSPPGLPSLSFKILNERGIVLATLNANPVAMSTNFQWTRVAVQFQMSPTSNTVYIVVASNGAGTCGNDFVIDDINFAICFPPIIATFNSNSTFASQKRICAPGPVELYSYWPPTGNPFTNPSYKWQYFTDGNPNIWYDIPNSNSPNIIFNVPERKIYGIRVIAYETSNPNLSLTSTYWLSLSVIRVFIDYNPNTVNICQGSSITLPVSARLENAPGDPSYNWTWSPGTNLSATNVEKPIFSAPSSTPPPANSGPAAPVVYSYTVTATTFEGCIGQATIPVSVKNPRMVAVPNAFTPNNDGINDYFRPINLEDYHFGYRFEVFNRWGQRVFVSDGPDFRWDGRINGVLGNDGENFTWQITGNAPGCPINSITPGFSGNVVLLR